MWCCSSSEFFVAVVLLPGWICSGFQLQATARILLYCGGFCVAFECMCGNPLYYIYVHGFSCCMFVHVASAFFAREYYGKYACKCCIPMHSQCGWSCACVSRRLFLPGHRWFVISKNHVCYYRGEICEHYRSRQSNRTTVPKAWIYVNSAKNVTCKLTQNFIEHATLYFYIYIHYYMLHVLDFVWLLHLSAISFCCVLENFMCIHRVTPTRHRISPSPARARQSTSSMTFRVLCLRLGFSISCLS